jgi:soluble epoxide hydrolase/lipid-phosphate phosphatase
MMHDMVSDLVCVLENAKVEKAICVGSVRFSTCSILFALTDSETRHDWGAQVCWEAGRSRPDVFDAVAGAVVPVSTIVWTAIPLSGLSSHGQYIPSHGDFVPVEELTKVLKKLTYQVRDAALSKIAAILKHGHRFTLKNGPLKPLKN